MKRKRIINIMFAFVLLFTVVMTAGCGKNKDGIKRLKLSINTNQSQVDMAEAM